MTHFFNQNYLEKIKNDPVMNAVFNRDQKVRRYDTRLYTGYRFHDTTRLYDGRGDTQPIVPQRNPQPIEHISEFNRHGEFPQRYRTTDYNEYTRINPNLYWINMLPQNLYDINRVIQPNPIIQQLKTLPVHISRLNQSFS